MTTPAGAPGPAFPPPPRRSSAVARDARRHRPAGRRGRRGRGPVVAVSAGVVALALAGYGAVRMTAGSGARAATTAAGTKGAAGSASGAASGSMAGMAMNTSPAAAASAGLNAVRVPMDKASMTEMAQVLALVPVKGATAVAARSGAWTDPATWKGGSVPAAGAKVVVPARVTVTYATTTAPAVGTLRVDGTLAFAPAVRSRLVVDTIVVTPTGTLQIGTPAAPVTAGVDVVFKGRGAVSDPYRYGRGLVSMGRAVINGRTRTAFLPLAVQPVRGARTLQLPSAPAGWAKGDTVVVSGTHWRGSGPRQDERRTIAAISGRTLTLNQALRFDHRSPVAAAGAYVADFTRSITFSSASTRTAERGHVMFMHSDAVAVHGAAFVDLGRTDKNRFADTLGVTVRADKHTTAGRGTNPLGRYALHFHRAGVGAGRAPIDVSDDAIMGSPGWGLVNHDSFVAARDDAVWNVLGAAYVTEVGDERGSFVHDVAIGSDGPGPRSERHALDFGGPHNDTVLHDMWADGFGFGMRSNAVALVGDVATDQAAEGFSWNGWDADKYSVPLAGRSVAPDQVPVFTFSGSTSVANRIGAHLDDVAVDRPGKYSVIGGFTAVDSGEEGIRIRYAAVVLRQVRVVNPVKGAKLGIELGPNGSGTRNEGDFTLVDVGVSGFATGIDNDGAQRTGDANRPADVYAYGVSLAGNGAAWSVPRTPYLRLLGAAPAATLSGSVAGAVVARPFAASDLAVRVVDGVGAQKPVTWTITPDDVRALLKRGYHGSASAAYVLASVPIQSRVTGARTDLAVRVAVTLAEWPGHGGLLR